MLMQIGTVTFEVWPLNIDEYDRETGYDFVAKDIMGSRRSREAMGEGDETMTLSGKILPHHFGGLGTLEELHTMRQSGMAQKLVRGDGKNLGWFTIDKVRERSRFLDAEGVGREIVFDVALTASNKPSPSAYFSTLMRIFLG